MTLEEFQSPQFKTEVLERMRIGFANYCSESMIRSFDFRTAVDVISDMIRFGVTAHWFCKEWPATIEKTEYVPATWVDAVRERWLPAFILKRYPIRRRAIPVLVKRVFCCPHLNADPLAQHLHFVSHPGLAGDMG